MELTAFIPDTFVAVSRGVREPGVPPFPAGRWQLRRSLTVVGPPLVLWP
jgi:hypothetical protein